MYRRLASLLLPLFLLTSPGTAQEAGKTVPPGTLVPQLGSPDFRVREEASKMLIAHGAAALPVLRKALDHSDFEVRRRLEQIITQVEEAAAVAPKQVSLRL